MSEEINDESTKKITGDIGGFYSEDLTQELGVQPIKASRNMYDYPANYTGKPSFKDLVDGVSSRPGFTRDDYEFFRPEEAVAKSPVGKIFQADVSYYDCGLIRNIIDLMGDFTSQGIHITHPNKRHERFFRTWWKKIGGDDVSERFINLIYRIGNVVVQRFNYSIQPSPVQLEQLDIEEVKMKPNGDNPIPIKYVLYKPTEIELENSQLAGVVGVRQYVVPISANLKNAINKAIKEKDSKVLSKIPKEMLAAVVNGAKEYRLPIEDTDTFFYKKDDGLLWAVPMIYSIQRYILLLEKLRLADVAALDGAISKVRIFKLGDLEHQIIPTRAGIAKLRDALSSNVGGGTVDLIWTPDIDLIETDTDVHNFLGEEKYKPTMNAIYAGLGIPPTLTGTFGAAGTTNNYISLKTLIERLEYGRRILLDFWQKEIKRVQKAMGFGKPANIEFTWTSLGDEESERQLLLQLADRGLVSEELLRMYLKHNPEMEKLRLQKEYEERSDGTTPPKAGPYNDPQQKFAFQKIALDKGYIAPKDVGLKSSVPVVPQDVTEKDIDAPAGRPKNSKDQQKRDRRSFKPAIKADQMAHDIVLARECLKIAEKEVLPVYLAHLGKRDKRQLTSFEAETLGQINFGVLYRMSREECAQVVENGGFILDNLKSLIQNAGETTNERNTLYAKFAGTEPKTVDARNQIQAFVCAYRWGVTDADLQS